jgi:luciferase family oxidoreductase group 1
MTQMRVKPMKIPFSILDLATITEGGSPAESFRRSKNAAILAERTGYTRYWFAEHHNMASVASSATSLLIGHIAGATHSIRVGSGGIMLPNHSPLIIAEQFGTLESLYPGRIDLGLGRAPGSDPATSVAIRGANIGAAGNFAEDIAQLQTYFSPLNSSASVRAIPGEGLDVPLWILGSSTESAILAGILGLPYAFASHFAPGQFPEATALYRKHFRPSAKLSRPYIMACVNVIIADNDKQASFLATSLQQLFMGIVTGKRKPLPPPVPDMSTIWNNYEKEFISGMLKYSFIGGPARVKKEITAFLSSSGVDEVMSTSHIFDSKLALESISLFADLMS